GDDLDLQRDVTGVDPADPITKAWLTIKHSPTVLDAQASLQKIITNAQIPGTGQITQDGSADNGNGTASLFFQLTAANTALLGTSVRYYYDIQVRTSSNKIYTAEEGRLQLSQGITDATS